LRSIRHRAYVNATASSKAGSMATVQVRYIVHDVDAAISFYVERLGFQLVMHPAPPFAMLTRGDLRLVLSALPVPGGWNRFAIEVDDLGATVANLTAQGAAFRTPMTNGVGGRQAILEDPSGNPIELFEPTRPEARLGR
jgi:catechol 2,3-dioxygenase-like lactoylglutathione lyase family enzyme